MWQALINWGLCETQTMRWERFYLSRNGKNGIKRELLFQDISFWLIDSQGIIPFINSISCSELIGYSDILFPNFEGDPWVHTSWVGNWLLAVDCSSDDERDSNQSSTDWCFDYTLLALSVSMLDIFAIELMSSGTIFDFLRSNMTANWENVIFQI